jgi:H+/Cl- antiporter ClcA
VIGAAAMVSSVTHTISFALVIFELNGEIKYLVPVLLGTLMAYLVGTSMSISFFEFLLHFKGMPYMPSYRPYLM